MSKDVILTKQAIIKAIFKALTKFYNLPPLFFCIFYKLMKL